MDKFDPDDLLEDLGRIDVDGLDFPMSTVGAGPQKQGHAIADVLQQSSDMFAAAGGNCALMDGNLDMYGIFESSRNQNLPGIPGPGGSDHAAAVIDPVRTAAATAAFLTESATTSSHERSSRLIFTSSARRGRHSAGTQSRVTVPRRHLKPKDTIHMLEAQLKQKEAELHALEEENEKLKTSAATLIGATKYGNRFRSWLSTGLERSRTTDALDLAAGLRSPIEADLSSVCTMQDAKAATLTDLRAMVLRLWEVSLQYLLLLETGRASDADGAAYLSLYKRSSSFLDAVALVNPTLAISLATVNVVTGLPGEVSDAALCAAIAKAGFTQQQRQRVMSISAEFDALFRRVRDVRAGLVAALGTAVRPQGSASEVTDAVRRDAELTEQLQRSLRKEAVLKAMYVNMLHAVVTPEQHARLLIECHPFVPAVDKAVALIGSK